jgi:DNA-binding response OmpR family regulator
MVKKILIIDDEVDLCLLLKNFFTQRNFQVSISHKLSEGLDNAKRIDPDFIFLDNNLPDAQGWSKAEWILSELPNTNLFLISAYKTVPSIPKNPRLKVIEKPLSLRIIENLVL